MVGVVVVLVVVVAKKLSAATAVILAVVKLTTTFGFCLTSSRSRVALVRLRPQGKTFGIVAADFLIGQMPFHR